MLQQSTTVATWREFEQLQLGPILEKALEAFYENGFHGTTVRELARRVGVTVPALYYHHESKEAMLIALLDAPMQDLIDRCQGAIADGGHDPVLRFTYFIEAVVLNMTHRAQQAALDSEIRHLPPDNRQNYAATRKRLELMALDLVTEGVEKGLFDVEDIDETVRALLGMCQSIARWFQIDGSLNPDEVGARYTAIALRIVGHPTTSG